MSFLFMYTQAYLPKLNPELSPPNLDCGIKLRNVKQETETVARIIKSPHTGSQPLHKA